MSHSDLLRNLVDHPESIGARKVYADWLMDRGDPRGEFIAIQCELANLADDDPRLPKVERRQNELLYKHAHDWRLNLEQTQRFENGFVQTIACPQLQGSTTELVGNQRVPLISPRERERQLQYRIPHRLERLFAESPISSLVNWIPTLRGSHVSRIRELSYPGRSSEARELKRRFLNSKWPENLRALAMTWISLEDLRPAIDAQKFSRLSQLSLSRNLLGSRQQDELAGRFLDQLPEQISLRFATGWSNIARLGQWLNKLASRDLFLEVHSTQWSGDTTELGVDIPLSSILLWGLKIRGLTENSPDSPGLILNLDWAQHIKTLTLEGEFRWSVQSPFTSMRDCQAVETIERLNFLTHLNSHRYPMEDWAAAIGDFHWRSLRRLKIRATNGQWQAGQKNPVVRLLDNPPDHLRRLDLSYCHLTDSDVASLLSCPGIKQLTHLSFRKNSLTNKSIDLIRKMGPWPNLVALDLSGNRWLRDPALSESFGTRLWNVDWSEFS